METKQQLSLFKYPRLRTRDGRFCTSEQYRLERVEGLNKRLIYEKEKYLRAWLAAADRCAILERELRTLRDKIKEL